MAGETLPTRATISWENYLTRPGAAIISATSERNAFRATNLLSPLRSKRWRSTSSTLTQKIKVNLGAPVTPTVFGLIDCNLDAPGAIVTLRSDIDSTMTNTPVVWNFLLYGQSQRGTWRRFLGPADSGAPDYPLTGDSRQFWELQILADTTTATYDEIGVWWLGTYDELPLDEGLERRVIDPSLVFVSDGGAAYFDRRPTYQEVEDSASFMLYGETAAFEANADRFGRANRVLLDLWSPVESTEQRARGCYYGIMGRSDEVLSLVREMQHRDNLSWSFTETRG